ncbi:basic salivary proline-rich protein 1-like [Leopardus geoffroyi]|uniref:basic salivary proline-rich protein 1-like n=1 Tax=Leopardus geoffroyi TaxID=46844 RepID=UPI001E2632D1|nr:basic salivary proline-rich protein 1-like [Leopardus geoffroyi]
MDLSHDAPQILPQTFSDLSLLMPLLGRPLKRSRPFNGSPASRPHKGLPKRGPSPPPSPSLRRLPEGKAARSPALGNSPFSGSVRADPTSLAISPSRQPAGPRPTASASTYGADPDGGDVISRSPERPQPGGGRCAQAATRTATAERTAAASPGQPDAQGARAGRLPERSPPPPPPPPHLLPGKPWPRRLVSVGNVWQGRNVVVQTQEKLLLWNPEGAPKKALRKYLSYLSSNT